MYGSRDKPCSLDVPTPLDNHLCACRGVVSSTGNYEVGIQCTPPYVQSVHSITNPQSSTFFPSQMCTEADRGHGQLTVGKEGYIYRHLGVCFGSSDWMSISDCAEGCLLCALYRWLGVGLSP